MLRGKNYKCLNKLIRFTCKLEIYEKDSLIRLARSPAVHTKPMHNLTQNKKT